MHPSKKISTAALLAIFVLTWIHPIWPMEQALHTSLTVVGVVALWRYALKNTISEKDFFHGWTRNYFDRLVHLLYGICLAPLIASHAIRHADRHGGQPGLGQALLGHTVPIGVPVSIRSFPTNRETC
jgi:putative membrane protein